MGKNLIRITLVSILILILSISFFACKRSKGVTDPNLAEAERAELGKTGNEEVSDEETFSACTNGINRGASISNMSHAVNSLRLFAP